MFDYKNFQKLFKVSLFLLFSVFFVLDANPVYAKKQESLFSPIFLNEGVRYYKEGDLQNAISSFKKSLSLSSTDISSLLLLAQVSIEDGKPEQAIKILQAPSKLYSSDSLIHFTLGMAYEQNKQPKEALLEYKSAIAIDPENILIKYSLGNICSLTGDYRCAIENLGKVILAYPLHLRSRLLLASSYHHLKQYALAKEEYKNILEYLSTNPIIWYNLSKTQIALEEFEDAKQSINQAILLDNSTVEFYLDRAQLNYKLSSLENSDNDYLVALKLEPKNPAIPIEYANFLWKTGAYSKAAEQYEKAIQLQPGDVELIVSRAYLLQLSKRYPESIELWNEVLGEDNENQFALFNLARLYHDSKNYDNAIDYYKRLISLKGITKETELDGKLGLAYCLQKRGSVLEAKNYYSELVKDMPENSNILFEYGNILVDEKNYKDSIGYFKKSIEQRHEPQKEVYEALVNAYENLNDISNLKIAYKEWLNVDKDNVDARIGFAKQLAKHGDTQEAIEQYRVAVALDNTNASRYKLAQFLIEQNDLYGAIGQLQEYLKANSSDLNALILLANAFKELGINEQAINTYKKIVSLQPENHLTYFNLGLLYQQEKKTEEAQNYLLKTIELNESYAPAYYALGLSYLSLGDSKNEKAKELFEKYLKLEPSGEYRDKAEAFLKEILSKPAADKQEKV